MKENLWVKVNGAESAEEIASLAAELGITLTAEQAKTYYANLHSRGEIADEELDNVAGGGCNNKDKNETVYTDRVKCPNCSASPVECNSEILNEMNFNGDTTLFGWHIFRCPNCGGFFRDRM